MKQLLRGKQETGTLRVGVLGLGRSGYALASRFGQSGVRAVGFTLCPATAEMTNNGCNFTKDPDLPEWQRRLVYDEWLRGTTDFAFVVHRDVVFVCVEDLCEEYGRSTAETARHFAEGIGAAIRKNTLVVFIQNTAGSLSLAALTAAIRQKSGLAPETDFDTCLLTKAEVDAKNPAELLRLVCAG